jgi:hypothetical protein
VLGNGRYQWIPTNALGSVVLATWLQWIFFRIIAKILMSAHRAMVVVLTTVPILERPFTAPVIAVTSYIQIIEHAKMPMNAPATMGAVLKTVTTLMDLTTAPAILDTI